MVASRWRIVCSFYLLLQHSMSSPPIKRYYGDVSDNDAMIDNLQNYMNNENWQNDQEQMEPFYQDLSYESVPLKIPFAVAPNDLRYIYPSSVLREAAAHSNVYGYDSLSPESRQALQAVWNEDAQRRRAAFMAMNQRQQFHGSQDEVNALHGHHTTDPQEHHVEKVQDSNLMKSQHHVDDSHLPPFLTNKNDNSMSLPNFYFVALVSGLTAVAVCAVVGAGICYFRLHKSKREAAEAEYPAYGVTGPNKDLSPGAADRKLAQSAHMFHYQHQKQQMIALEKSADEDRHCSANSDADSEEEGDEGDYTVYECPGLAPTGEMEVKNPLFSDDPTPATPPPARGAQRDSLVEDGNAE